MININPIHNSNKKLYGIDLYLDLIKEWVRSRGFTPHGLAKAAKFGPGTFADMYTTRWNPRASTLRELEGFIEFFDLNNTNKHVHHGQVFKSIGNDISDPNALDIYLHKIRGWVTSREFTPHGLAKAAKFGPGTLADMYTTRWNPRASTLRELEGFMIRYDEIHIDKKSVEYYYSKSDNNYENRLDIGIYAIKHFLYQTLRTSIINQRLILSK